MGGTEKLTTTNAEVCYYLRDKAGKLGNYLCDIMIEEEGAPDDTDGNCRSSIRVIWDLAAIAVLRMADDIGGMIIVPAKTITADGMWRDLNAGRDMIYVEWFRRNGIMSDFYTVIRKAELR